MTTRLHTREDVSILNRADRRPMIRAILEARLTETQYRRTALVYGLNGGRPLSYRDVAETENVGVARVHKAVSRGFEEVKNDVRLWALWLIKAVNDEGYDPSVSVRGNDSVVMEEGENSNLDAYVFTYKDEDGVYRQHPFAKEDDQEIRGQWQELTLAPSGDRYSSDSYAAPGRPAITSYDTKVETLTNLRKAGHISRFVYDRGLMLALAEEQAGRDGPGWQEFVDAVEEALLLRDLNSEVMSEEKCQQVLSSALRSYVGRA